MKKGLQLTKSQMAGKGTYVSIIKGRLEIENALLKAKSLFIYCGDIKGAYDAVVYSILNFITLTTQRLPRYVYKCMKQL